MKSAYLILVLFSLPAFAIYGLQYLSVSLPQWVRFYAADFLCMPIVLSICALTVQKFKRNPELQLSLFSIVSLTSFYAVYFEWFLPKNSPRYTADALDVLMYFLGAGVFYGLQKISGTASDGWDTERV